MTFLELVNRARRESGVSGAALSSVATDSALTAEGLRFKYWVIEAWREIQTQHADWNWMRKPVSFNTTAGVNTYAPAACNVTDLGDWKRNSFRAYTTSMGYGDEQILPFMEYETFRNVYLYGNMRTTQSRPVSFTINPADKSLILGAVPNDDYTVVGEYFKKPVDLSADSDTPELPDRYHMFIVYKAMSSYAFYESAPEVLERAQRGEKKMLTLLEFDQMPVLTSGPPLA